MFIGSSMIACRRRLPVLVSGVVLLSALLGVSLTPDARSALASTCAVSSGGIVYADQCTGADAGAQIQAALAALGSSSGIVDARGLHQAPLAISESLTVGVEGTSGVQLLLGPGKWTVSHSIGVTSESSIVGFPIGMTIGGQDAPATTLFAANSAGLAEVVLVGNGTGGGEAAVLQDIVVDGNKSSGGTTSSGSDILVNGAGRVDLTRVTAQNSAGDGILIQATNGNASCCHKLTKVMALGNAGSGLDLVGLANAHSDNPSDVFASQCEFEGNGGSGVRLMNAGAFRVTNSDFGGNGTGLWNGGISAAEIMEANQFGNQSGHDIQLSGNPNFAGMNIIQGNQFIGSGNRQSNFDAIQIWYTSDNEIVGNAINMLGSPNNLYAGVQFVSTNGSNTVMSNTFVGGGTYILGNGAFPSPSASYNLEN
jgi:hypothetical protein